MEHRGPLLRRAAARQGVQRNDVIDDFGRQKFAPNDLLNRWIVPMENQIDFMKPHTGISFTLPSDVLLMFSTNLPPADLMDAAFLRRIQYKIKLFEPTHE